MTRREFIRKLIKGSSAILVGTLWLVKKASPRRFVRALRVKKYPGHLKSLKDIWKEAKWSG